MSGYGAVEELMLSMEGLRGDGGEGRGAGGEGEQTPEGVAFKNTF